MARIRTIKPEMFQDEKLAPLDPVDRLVFLGLIAMADDCGRLLDNVKVIDAFVFPETSHTARETLNTLAAIGRIERGTTASGQRVIQIVNWAKHQRVDRPNTAAALPEIVAVQEVAGPRDSFAGDSREIRGGFAADSRPDLRPTTNDQRPATDEAEADPRERARAASRGGGDGVTGWSDWLASVPDGYRPAIEGALRAHRQPDSLRRELLALTTPITGGTAYPPPVVAQAVHELAVAGSPMGSAALRAFCRRIVQGEPPPRTTRQGTEIDWDAELTKLAAEAARQEAA